jgi:adenine phosphoribosyltransferase
LGKGFVPIRKKGKLPAEKISHEYDLEYGTDTVEIHKDAIGSGAKVLLIDDLLATGGTALASAALIEKLGGTVSEMAFIVSLPEVGGYKKLTQKGYKVFFLTEFEGD